MLKLNKQKNLFLFDGLGAVVSAIMLGLVLPRLESYVGMPSSTLYFLAALPCVFILYDLFAYFQSKESWRGYLKGIATANLFYCLVSAFTIYYHFDTLTSLGLAYFFGEKLVVIALALYEFRIAAR